MTGPAKPPALLLAPRLGGGRAFEQIARACLDHADANQPFVEVHGDHEGLHQFRVAYRRLRSLFSLAREVVRVDPEAARIAAGLRELTVALGPARDLDVFLEAHPYLTLDDSRRLDAARVAAYERAHEFLASPSWLALRADLDRWLDAGTYRDQLGRTAWSGRHMAARALERRMQRILNDGAHLADLDPPARHKVRIEAKKVRYGSQFYGSLWPRSAREAAKMERLLGGLQDRLGALNDAVTWASIERLAGLVDAEPPEVDVEAEVAAAQGIVDTLSTVTPYWRVSWRPAPTVPRLGAKDKRDTRGGEAKGGTQGKGNAQGKENAQGKQAAKAKPRKHASKAKRSKR